MKTSYARQLAYAIFLTLAIPSLLVLIVFWNFKSFSDTVDSGLRRQAAMVADSFAPNAVAHLNAPDQLEADMRRLIDAQPTIKEMTVYSGKQGSFSAVASTSPTKRLQLLNELTSNIAWKEGRAVANVDAIGPDNERIWTVVAPLKDSSNAQVALMQIKLSTADTDRLVQTNYQRTVLFLAIELVVILLLLTSYFQFASYARLYRDMQEVDRLRRGFLNVVSQGLELPAISIKNFAGILAKNYGTSLDQRGRDYLDSLAKHSINLVNIVISLAEYTRSEQEEITIQHEPIDLVATAEQASQELRLHLAESRIQVLHQSPGKALFVRAGIETVKQVISNLVFLVSRYAPGSVVTLSYSSPNVHSCELVIDCPGIQVDQAARQAFFTPHLQVTDEKLDTFADLGVLFLVCSRLIQKVGGEMRAEFEIDGRPKFIMRFPLTSAKAQHHTISTTPVTEQPLHQV